MLQSFKGYALVALLFIPLLLGISAFSLKQIDNTKTPDWYEGQFTYLPSGKFLKPAALDFDEALADGLWIEGMIYFADSYLKGKSYEWLGHIIDITTTLNPKFAYAYEFAGTVLSRDKATIPKTLIILERGMKEIPEQWRLNVYASMAQLLLDSNYIKASEYLKPLTQRSEIPEYAKTLSATMLTKGSNKQAGLAFLLDQYIQSNNPINQEIFFHKILKIYAVDKTLSDMDNKKVQAILKQAHDYPQYESLILQALEEFLEGKPSDKTRAIFNSLKL